MKGVGTRLRKRAEQLELSDADVARALDMQPRRYNNYINDEREPDFATLLQISDVLKTTPNHILGISDLDEGAATSDHLPAYGGKMNAGTLEIAGTPFTSIARYDARVSAGPGSIIDPHAEPLGYQLVESSWLQSITVAKAEFLALLRVGGDSMEDTLFDGDWVLIDRTQRRVSREGIYALGVGEDAWIKRLTLDLAAKKVRMISDNAKYPPQLLREEDLRVIGRYLALVWRKSAA
jgi:phage repressor protein C with HTH and peptisase S24 domain